MRPGIIFVLLASAGLMFFFGGAAPGAPFGTIPYDRVLGTGPMGCVPEEGSKGDLTVSSLNAAWWWFWGAQGRLKANWARTAPGASAAEALRERGEGYAIFISTYERTLTLYEDGEEVKQFPVAVGKPSTPTPPGEWRITNKSLNWGGGFGTRWLGINVPWGIYGIHGTNNPPGIGSFISGGCVRMFNAHVEELYDIVPVGTPVHVEGPLPSVAARPAIEGGSGKFMLVAQVRLRQAGFDPGPIDGRFGDATAGSIRELYGFYGLPEKGGLTRDMQRLIYFPE